MKKENLIPTPNLLCFSHLRWDFVFQRPQHLLSRFARHTSVYYLEEPVFSDTRSNVITIGGKQQNLSVLVPHLDERLDENEVNTVMTTLLGQLLQDEHMDDWTFWYYTPMAYAFSAKHKPGITVYDCMDELSAFRFAPPKLIALEQELIRAADLVFTGGHSLYEAKKRYHAHIFPFPSSIDKAHFAQARNTRNEPPLQSDIDGVKIGFFGVLDERFDAGLIGQIASLRPAWQLIMIGPVVKISEDSLPQNTNIHYLGQQSYAELPGYLSGWDVALIPFLLNESTAFISPTKTPEYLAAGVPVVSTPIADVVKPYGVMKLVHIGTTAADFVAAIEFELANRNKAAWLGKVDAFLTDKSWDRTAAGMATQINNILNNRGNISIAS